MGLKNVSCYYGFIRELYNKGMTTTVIVKTLKGKATPYAIRQYINDVLLVESMREHASIISGENLAIVSTPTSETIEPPKKTKKIKLKDIDSLELIQLMKMRADEYLRVNAGDILDGEEMTTLKALTLYERACKIAQTAIAEETKINQKQDSKGEGVDLEKLLVALYSNNELLDTAKQSAQHEQFKRLESRQHLINQSSIMEDSVIIDV